MTKKQRRKNQKGAEEKRFFLVVIDESPELHQALYFACRRAKRQKGSIALMYCIPPAEFQHFAGVGELMKEEAREVGEKLLREKSEFVHNFIGENPIIHMREGDPKDELINLINEEDDISILILGASPQSDQPGPLVNYLITKGVANCPVPIIIVPGNLSDEEIDKVT